MMCLLESPGIELFESGKKQDMASALGQPHSTNESAISTITFKKAFDDKDVKS